MRLKIVFMLCAFMFVTGCSDRRLTFIDGDKISLSEFDGRWLIINYWAAWCNPCVTEIPELNEFNERTDVEVLAFNYDQPNEVELKKQIKKFDIHYRSLVAEPSLVFQQSKPTGLPATMVISPQGEFIKWLYGAQTIESLSEAIAK